VAARAALVVVLALSTTAGAEQPWTPSQSNEPRWRLRLSLLSGFGGSWAHDDVVAMFPTTLELGVRAFGPLSFDFGVTGVAATVLEVDCGVARRPHAVFGSAGVRIDFVNRRAGSWVDPFLESHLGIGSQEGGHDGSGMCVDRRLFAAAGVRGGIDVWLGQSAVTVALGYDYLPTASPLSFSLGFSRVLK
jgi:hypothetical protein